MMDKPVQSDLAALETFVVNNEHLLQLEEQIGRFNIFDALGIVRREICHSNFLAWLLDPSESHGQGALFLRAILMDLLRQSPPEQRPFSPILLDGAELRGVSVRREHRNIDILIECGEPRFVIAIENKVDSKEHPGQLRRYRDIVSDLFGDAPCQYVFLTRKGEEPSEEEWTSYTYGEIYESLMRVRNANEKNIGDDVLTFLDHYLNLIRSRFMDDPKIDDLCQTIYKNHRQALRLILEKVGSGDSEIISRLAELINHQSGWTLLRETVRWVFMIPSDWNELFSELQTHAKRSDRPLIVYANVWQGRCTFAIEVGEFEDQDQRQQLIRISVKRRA